MVILEPLSFSLGIFINLRAGTVLVQLDGSHSALSPVVHGDSVLIINTMQAHSLITAWLVMT